MLAESTVALIGLLLNLVFIALVITAIVVVIKLPALLERQAAQQSQIQGTLREILAEIRSVTKADS
ncbi:hypothetical protein [Enhygromyxa salina]|uniref:Uncharacterized protein n=1 Tax=Enhygromyxa salina TaxID=215803 RepID=A0A2S9YQM2_9BACT|nr:hypothetical protein [Enhygromyxa salina]PRQ07376.1 hypothetical protein ENSA7_30890 [Enhygromyxa salina]